jgi:hypothetical protein
MKAILHFLKSTSAGEKLFESNEELTPNEFGDVNTVKQQLAFKCPTCGALHEENLIKTSCTVCGGACCPFCHEESKSAEKLKFEMHIAAEKECLRWISESPRLFGDSRFMKLVRKVQWLKAMRRLDYYHYKLEQTNAKQLPWKNSKR